jgi:phosphoserine phosphatase
MPEALSRALVLSAPPGRILSAATLERAGAAVGKFHVIEDGWLAEPRVRGFRFAAPADLPLAQLRRAVTAALDGEPLDIALVADDISFRRRKLLVADMESTIIEQEMLDELADFIGARDKIAEITERAMRGEIDFEAALKARVGMLSGLDATVLDRVSARMTYMPGARTLVATMKAHGAYCALVSGGFTVFTSRIAQALGFDEHQANVLEIQDGKLTGRVREPILGRAAKRAAIERLTAKLGLDPAQTLAVGDGANDLDMLGAAGLGVAFRAKPKVREATAAMENGAVITHGDLTSLLHLQGYRDDEFAA